MAPDLQQALQSIPLRLDGRPFTRIGQAQIFQQVRHLAEVAGRATHDQVVQIIGAAISMGQHMVILRPEGLEARVL